MEFASLCMQIYVRFKIEKHFDDLTLSTLQRFASALPLPLDNCGDRTNIKTTLSPW